MFDPFEVGRRYTVEEYLRLEETSDVKHEYMNGIVFEVGNPPKPKPLANAEEVFIRLTNRVRSLLSTPGLVVTVDDGPSDRGSVLLVRRTADGDIETDTTRIEDPTSVVLLTSATNYLAAYHDRFCPYLENPSVMEITWIFADTRRMEGYKRGEEKTWQLSFSELPDFVLYLHSIGVQLAIVDVYGDADVAPK